MKLSPNFSLEELTFSQVASRRGLDNTPPLKVKENLERLAFFLEQVRKIFNKPLLISSGYRSREVNEAVGGSKTSQHCEGCAADFNVKGMSPDAVVRAIVANDIPYDQVILEFDSWVHISIPNTKDLKPRKQALIIDNKGKREFK
jgi:zinc D-Ala-D-Ala carboxypeptidase